MDKQRSEELSDLGIFRPLRSCPLKNGIGLIKDEDVNWCHDGCAWAVKNDLTVDVNGVKIWRGYCGIVPKAAS